MKLTTRYSEYLSETIPVTVSFALVNFTLPAVNTDFLFASTFHRM